MQDDLTEITLINPKPTRPPSLLMNMATLIVLFCLVVGAKYLSNRWLTKNPPEEHSENQIVMEDLENEKPIADSAPIVMPETAATPEAAPAAAPAEEAMAPIETAPAATAPVVSAPVVETPKPIIAKKVSKKKVAAKKRRPKKAASVAASDPYTSGGPLDLDRKENQTDPTIVKTMAPSAANTTTTVATPSTSTMDERDKVIPFESH